MPQEKRNLLPPFTMPAFAATAASAVLLGATGAWAAPALSLDINARANSGLTESGFIPFTLDGTGGQQSVARTDVGGTGIDVSITVFDSDPAPGDTDGAMDDRVRTTPPDSGDFTFGDLYRDFIFVGGSAGQTGGVDIAVSGLQPNTPYTVTIYAFDSASNGPRIADYTANGNFLLTTSFDGTANDPNPGGTLLSNDQFAFTGTATTDAAGDLLIAGRASGTNIPAVFINAMEFEVVPEPASLGLLSLAAVLALRRTRTAARR